MLGPLEVSDRGRPLKVPGQRPRALLAVLALNAGRVLAADRLVELLWGDDPPASAANALQVHIASLRKVLEPDGPPYRVLISDRGGYALTLEPDEIDLARFERLVEQGHEALIRDDPQLSARVLDEAVRLWRGSALSGLDPQPWLVREARRLEELKLAALEDRMDARLTLGQHRELVGELEVLVAEHPLRERLRGQLMLALYRSGRQAHASDVYQEGRRVLVEELGMEPGYELQQLLKAILTQDESLRGPTTDSRTRPLHNLPAPLTSFVGRERELREVAALLDRERLVTLTGPGGIGKTRLAVEIARRRLSAYKLGIWLITLAPVRDADSVATAVATGVGARPRSGQTPIDAVAGRLSSGNALLVLDGCEHLVEACAKVAEEVLDRCSGITLLATSRETLGIDGERGWQVPPLDLPTPDRAAEQAGAVDLFLQRATAAGARDLDGDALETVAAICRRLDGIPLALELAAARLKLLSLDSLSARLDDRFRVLTGGSRMAPSHHQTLRAAIDWSYELLSDQEAALLQKLSVFAGSFSLDAVEAACDNEPAEDPLELLSGVVRKSMVTIDRAPLEVRYRLLETIREYAREKLRDSNQADAIGARHADFFLDLVERAAPQMRGRNAAVWIGRVGAEHDNVRAALSWLAGHRDTERLGRALVCLWWFWYARCFFEEGRRWLNLALTELPSESETVRFSLLLGAGQLAWAQGDIAAARGWLDQANALASSLDDEALQGQALLRLSLPDYAEARIEDAERHLRSSIEALRRHGPQSMLAEALNNLGWIRAIELGDESTGAPLLHESVAVARACGDQYTLLQVLDSLAHLHMRDGDLEGARLLQEESLRICDQIGDSWGLPRVLAGFVRLAAAQGEAARALRLAGAADRLRDAVGMTLMPLEQALLDPAITAASDALDPDTARAAWEAGAAMTRSNAIVYALCRAPSLSEDR